MRSHYQTGMTTEKRLNIFLVDDNEIDIVVNTKLLKLSNITDSIHSYRNCEDFMDGMRDRANDIISSLNVILLDIQMPLKDGFECLSQLESLEEGILNSCKIFMLSSSIDRNDIQRAENNPLVIKVLEKPLDVYLLKRLLEE